jgi:RimJ/RimL family protein N-acetyltransferase
MTGITTGLTNGTTRPALFETDRLIVRHFQHEDLDDFAALMADPLVVRYMGDGNTLPREDVARWIDVCHHKYETRGYGTSAVFEKNTGNFIGYCGVVRAPGREFDEIVYAFAQPAWGKGYATEVARAMIAYVFGLSSLDRIYATIHPDNAESKKVAEKIGFRFDREEVEEGEDIPTTFYVIERPTK